MPKFRFPDGVATATGAYIIVQVMNDHGELFAGNLFVDYRFVPNPEGFATDWTTVSICYLEKENVAYAAGENGEILRISDSGNTEEFISPHENGPAIQGPIREIRAVGDSVYAVGMGRQIYRRTRDREWQHIDAGVLDVSGRATAGLTSITGDGHRFLVTVGYEGEIWELHRAWTKIDSPTNVLLTRVTFHNGNYYAAGVLGTLLCRGPNGWRVIDTGDFKQDIWDIETFCGMLYVGTTEGLFWMSPDEEIKRVGSEMFTRQVHCASLSAGRNRLWCFGGDIVSSTSNGAYWHEEEVF